MARKPKSNWNASIDKELQRAINNYNAKLRRLSKKQPDIAITLPEKVSKQAILAEIGSKRELNQVIASLRRFTTRGAEKAVEISPGKFVTSWEVENLQRSITNFNAKVERIAKRNPSSVDYLPSKVTKKSAMESIDSVADLRRVEQSLKRFSKPNAETLVSSPRGAKATQWEIDEFERNQAIENARRAREREALEAKEVKIAGKGQGKTRSQMGSIKDNELKPSRKKFENMSQGEWQKAKELMERRLLAGYTEEQRKLMQINYMRGMLHEGYDEELIKYISTIPTDKFFEITQTDETATIDFIYDPLALKTRQDTLWDLWEEHGSGKNVLGITMEDIQIAETLNESDAQTYFRNLIKGAK